MKIVTTPMCEEIVKLAGIKDYVVNKHPTSSDGDMAIILSESNVEIDAITIKINTPRQIFESIKKLSDLDDKSILRFFKNYPLACKYLTNHDNSNINVKVYSKFLIDIVNNIGFTIDDVDFDYVIYPDYLKGNVVEHDNLLEIPSHNSISKNPFEKIEIRYGILETLI